MTHPSKQLYRHQRELHEAAARRRVELSKMLRDDPKATNKQLAASLGVSRNTITIDRKIMVEELNKEALNETELLRADMCKKLENLNNELELHRRDGKLPVSVIHEMMLVNRTIIELLGVRKPVIEKMESSERKTVRFEAVLVPSPQRNVIDAEVVEPKLLATKTN